MKDRSIYHKSWQGFIQHYVIYNWQQDMSNTAAICITSCEGKSKYFEMCKSFRYSATKVPVLKFHISKWLIAKKAKYKQTSGQ